MNKGFTLVELLAVIVILSIIATITLYSTGVVLKDSKESLSKAQKDRLIEVAKIYYLNNSTATYVCISTLIDEGLIDVDEVLDPKTKEPLEGYITITTTGNKVRYAYDESDLSLCD